MRLDLIPATPEARALLDRLTGMVAAHQGKRRGPKLTARLSEALGAIVGALLTNWTRSPPRPVHHNSKAGNFSDGPIPYRQFIAALEGLEGLSLVVRQAGFQRPTDWGDGVRSWSGKAARFWPSGELLRIAAADGVTAQDVKTQFVPREVTKRPTVRKLLVVNSLKVTTGYRTGQSVKLALDETVLGAERGRLHREVKEANAFAAKHEVRGCSPPQWKRVFTVNAMLDGRWTDVGRERVYQGMSKQERLAQITIDGEPVAEVDVQASHLSIMHGLLGLPLPQGDLYGFPDVPRAVAKAWITATLGKGSPVTKWAAKALKDKPDLAGHDPRRVGQIICHRYPFLRRPAEAVAASAGLDRLAHIGPPARLLTHRLMAIEATALTGAMGYLRNRGVLALPMHDGLVVPISGAPFAPPGLVGGYAWAANGVRIRCSTELAPDAPRG